MCNILYEVFNNATTAAISAVISAGCFARFEYRRQKELERNFNLKRELINDIIFLHEKTDYVLLIIDRVANSYKITTKTDIEFFHETLEKYELPKLSDTINEEIPTSLLKVSTKINIYFSHSKKIVSQYKKFKSELKKWHDPIVYIKFDFKQRVEDQAILTKNNFDKESKKLVDIIWKEKI